jgi:enoyl-CoA hydratase
MSAEERFVKVERTGPVATVTIVRPDKMNALSAEVVADLADAFARVAADAAPGDEPTRAAILTGTGKAFVAGADIAQMQAMTPVQAKAFSDAGHRLMASIEALPFPVIAAVNGFALGGGLELALACDFIYAAENAKLGQPEVSLAVIPGFGGTARLARRVGVARAREIVYRGHMLSAAEGLAVGLVNAVFPAAELLLRTRDVALEIASKGPLAVAAAKRVLQRGQDLPPEAACELEAQAFAGLFGSEDQREGMRAFLAKEKAKFVAR